MTMITTKLNYIYTTNDQLLSLNDSLWIILVAPTEHINKMGR